MKLILKKSLIVFNLSRLKNTGWGNTGWGKNCWGCGGDTPTDECIVWNDALFISSRNKLETISYI